MNPRWERAIQAVAAAFFVLMVGILYLVIFPFSPHTIYGYEGLGVEVCEEETVRVWADKETAAWPEIDTARVASYWENVATGEPIGAIETPIPLYPTDGRVVEASPVLRDAPDAPGEYRLISDITVSGRSFFMPRPQKIHVESEEVLTVISKDDPRCPIEAGRGY